MTKGISLTFKGINRVANPIRTLAAQFPQVSDRVIGAWAKKTRERLKSKPYPAKLPNQRYVRTGELANRWAAVQVKVGQWTLKNARANVEYVIGDKQAQIHAGRWYLAAVEIETDRPALVADLTAAYKELLNP